jgi:hypothetical protein
MMFKHLAPVFALVAIVATPGTPWAGELHASYGSPQMRTIWQSTDTAPRKMTVEVTALGGAICTISATGGTTKRYETGDGKAKSDDITVPPKGSISITASDSGVAPKPAKGAAPVATSATCTYSVSDSKDLSN